MRQFLADWREARRRLEPGFERGLGDVMLALTGAAILLALAVLVREIGR